MEEWVFQGLSREEGDGEKKKEEESVASRASEPTVITANSQAVGHQLAAELSQCGVPGPEPWRKEL